MRRSHWFLIALLAGAAIVLLTRNPWNTLSRASRTWKLKKPDRVQMIRISSDRDTVVLRKSDTAWSLNGSQEVKDRAVDNLLVAGEKLEIASVYARFDPDSSWNHLQVVYTGRERTLTEYDLFLGEGRTVLVPGDGSTAFAVELPGFSDLDLQEVFSARPDHYRERLLLDLLPRDIRRIEVTPRKGTAFVMEQDRQENIRVYREPGSERVPDTVLSEKRVRLLFSYFTGIQYTRVWHETTSEELRTKSQVKAGVTVTDRSGRSHHMEIYPLLQDGSPDLFRALVVYNRFEHPYVMSYLQLDVLLFGLDHYLVNDGGQS